MWEPKGGGVSVKWSQKTSFRSQAVNVCELLCVHTCVYMHVMSMCRIHAASSPDQSDGRVRKKWEMVQDKRHMVNFGFFLSGTEGPERS